MRELNFANSEKQQLESSIQADEETIVELERSATCLSDQIEIANLNRLNLKSEVDRQKVLNSPP